MVVKQKLDHIKVVKEGKAVGEAATATAASAIVTLLPVAAPTAIPCTATLSLLPFPPPPPPSPPPLLLLLPPSSPPTAAAPAVTATFAALFRAARTASIRRIVTSLGLLIALRRGGGRLYRLRGMVDRRRRGPG
eukprot:CAMPEP_0206373792 /NCGR_PEP_ID=MMETSP0294-20121207/7924_1 /ASSEMBLY_ACC=CAM_ASM_000327 /TAXON_ID=39354 /ORGANISM="Heterosigma akashiwo, Strain CCMP2393" /LENGTH=133 /DNA_ID=CAMNT_0053821447 /DNA_START=230 /DNA_END=631 /DNA_ORIENTATION=-